jgi:hypothetical protein
VRRDPLVEVQQLVGLRPREPAAAGELLEAPPLGLVHREVGVEVHRRSLTAAVPASRTVSIAG